MKKIILLLSLALGAYPALSQIQIGSNEVATMNRAGKISDKDLARLKSSTTVFTLPFRDYKQQALFEEAIRSVWTVSPFKIIKPGDMGDYTGERYSIFSFGGYMVTNANSMTRTSNMHLAYDLWLPDEKRNGNVGQRYLARILMYPDNEAFFTATRNAGKRSEEFSRKMMDFVYNDGTLYNWSPGMLKGYLKLVNDRLAAQDERGPYSEQTDKQALKSLKTDTLYLPDYIQVKFNMLSGSEKADDDGADEELKKAYPYPVKVVTTEQLNALILDKSKSIKYLVYTKSSTDKYINVYESGTGALLYARYTGISYNFKNKDLSKLARVID